MIAAAICPAWQSNQSNDAKSIALDAKLAQLPYSSALGHQRWARVITGYSVLFGDQAMEVRINGADSPCP